MALTKSRVVLSGLAAVGAAVLFAGCGTAPTSGGGSTSSAAASDFLPCMVSDSGGFDDKSFNQAGFDGLTNASNDVGVEPITVESASETDFAPNLAQLVDQGCSLIVSVGFLLSPATVESALDNPEIEYAIIDDLADNTGAMKDGKPVGDGKIDAPNIKPLTFDTAQAAFLAGYAAASYSKTGVVGTFGGIPIPSVTAFMDGFANGVTYYNTENSKSVKVIGYDPKAPQNGVFTGGFEAGTVAKSAAQGLIDQNADVILPVGGPIFVSAGEAIRDAVKANPAKSIALIGVDSDNYVTAPEFKDLFLTSVMKGIAVGVEDAVATAAADKFSFEPFVGTLENEGVGLAPFHDFQNKVSPDLQKQLDEITEGIINGTIDVV